MTDHMANQMMECDPHAFEARRFLLLHAKSDDDARIGMLTALAREAVERSARGRLFSITPGRDQFSARFKACGSWDAWATECGAGVEYATRQPLFHGYLVPSVEVGAGTAKIIEHALRAGRRVLVFNGTGQLARVTAARCANAKDWQKGWRLEVGPFQ